MAWQPTFLNDCIKENLNNKVWYDSHPNLKISALTLNLLVIDSVITVKIIEHFGLIHNVKFLVC